ncbi:MAG: cobalamin biosynthesis protein CbiA [bacterium]|nr:cobalamin biosynthesis protein CbiA [bacterium]
MEVELKISAPILLPRDIIVIVGSYGSGKSEVAVNLARHLQLSQTEPVSIADLDIVNPYFRSREAIKVLNKLKVRSIVPEGGQFYADLPIILPSIKGAIENKQGKLILDVGGDDAGAKVLSSLTDAFRPDGYDMLMVINANRPFTSNMAGCIKMMNQIEAASRLKFTGLISNTHLMEHTTSETIELGLKLCGEVSGETSLPVRFVSAEQRVISTMNIEQIGHPVLVLDRLLLKPWEKPGQT